MKEITVNEVEQLIHKKEEIHLIDVREVEEVHQGKIPGAINIPLSLLEFRMHELDKDKVYTMICRSGARSKQATTFLMENGYHVQNMIGGMLAWEGPVE